MKYLTPNVADEDEYEYYTEDDSINNNEDTDDMYNEPEAAMSESYIYSNKLTINSGAMLNGTVVKLQKTEEPEIKTFETNSSLATNSNESSSKMENIRRYGSIEEPLFCLLIFRFLDVSAKLVENELDRLGDNHYVWIPHSRLGFCLGRVVFEDSKNETYTVKLEEEFEATHNQASKFIFSQ
jgi:hypothetical protein